MTATAGAAMLGKGAYNANSRPQANAAAGGIDLLVWAAARIEPGAGPIVIADYGAAEGRNSLVPMAAAIDAIRRRHATPITVVHLDRPDNDFSSLFTLLRTDPASYLAGRTGIFAQASGGSFYERMLPPGQVVLGWSSISLHWLSRLPAHAADVIWPSILQGEARKPFAAQAAADWVNFLQARSIEMRPGAALVVVVSTAQPDGSIGDRAKLVGCLARALDRMVDEGALRPEERARMTAPMFHRSRRELEAPFADPRQGLRIEAFDEVTAPDPFWVAYQVDRDEVARAQGYAGFFHAAFSPTLLAALDPARSAEDRDKVAESFRRRLIDEVLRTTGPLYPFHTATMLIVKDG